MFSFDFFCKTHKSHFRSFHLSSSQWKKLTSAFASNFIPAESESIILFLATFFDSLTSLQAFPRLPPLKRNTRSDFDVLHLIRPPPLSVISRKRGPRTCVVRARHPSIFAAPPLSSTYREIHFQEKPLSFSFNGADRRQAGQMARWSRRDASVIHLCRCGVLVRRPGSPWQNGSHAWLLPEQWVSRGLLSWKIVLRRIWEILKRRCSDLSSVFF